MVLIAIVTQMSCASRLVGLDQLDDAPNEYDQKISELSANVVEPPAPLIVPAAPGLYVPAKNDGAALTPRVAAAAKTKTKTPSKVLAARTLAPVRGQWKPAAWPYGIGEVAEYSLRYGLIEGGVVTMTTMPPKVIEGEKVLHYSGHVRSTRLLELFYKVDDTIDSWVSMESHLPIRQEIQQRESEQWGTRVVTFDRNKQTARFFATTSKKKKKKKIEKFDSEMDHFAQDIFSSLYFFRFVEPVERVNFSIHDRGKNWNNETIYLGTEDLDLPVGRTRARRYKLQPRVSGHLEPKGDVEAWFSDDDRRIMVKFRATIKFGSITGDLRKYQPGQRITVDPPVMMTPIDLDSLGNAKAKVPQR